ncbi:uncharacterized protein MELLADRAFT_123272 [Melampsora larici-populina 98AG31]|uniref:Secreted protein n=1 Tax=Melampsora larici-populina (strain 98AG31 / pathotype 3-4-7) TaxID=747676 RepID=F4RTE0_MELLP|nr:uncharacterized protein MELLADRAFT_123272 [Melampsora larici-populina 98AG31]EGG04356.1 secreted protein [Melampsora larici-populina 98AG31]
MSFRAYLTIVVLCITMCFLTSMKSVNAVDCQGGYDTDDTTAFCTVDEQQINLHHCDPARCGHDNARFVSWKKCVPFYKQDGTAESTQNCVSYGHYGPNHYTCTNANNEYFLCPHKLKDAPFISCSRC